jgi:hypothetical protein
MNLLFRLFLTFNSTSFIIVVYLIKSQTVLNKFFHFLGKCPHFVSYTIYIFIPVVLTFLSLLATKYLDSDSIEAEAGKSAIVSIEQANNSFLPSYLGYFFVALSVPSCETLIFIFAILFVFTFLSQTLYFNPIFLLFGYQFFYLTTENNIKIFLITKHDYKDSKRLSFPSLKRINDYTFIDTKKR